MPFTSNHLVCFFPLSYTLLFKSTKNFFFFNFFLSTCVNLYSRNSRFGLIFWLGLCEILGINCWFGLKFQGVIADIHPWLQQKN